MNSASCLAVERKPSNAVGQWRRRALCDISLVVALMNASIGLVGCGTAPNAPKAPENVKLPNVGSGPVSALNGEGPTSPATADLYAPVRKAISIPQFPCSIKYVVASAEGVRLRFSENMFWYFAETSGGSGMIGVGGVTRIVERPDGHDDVLPPEPDLLVKYGQELKLHEHHSACSIAAVWSNNHPLLRITRSMCLVGNPCRTEKAEHAL